MSVAKMDTQDQKLSWSATLTNLAGKAISTKTLGMLCWLYDNLISDISNSKKKIQKATT